jgi:hypothetical protein
MVLWNSFAKIFLFAMDDYDGIKNCIGPKYSPTKKIDNF